MSFGFRLQNRSSRRPAAHPLFARRIAKTRAAQVVAFYGPVAVAIAALIGSVSADDSLRREQEHFFEQEVRPLLAEHCFRCHGNEAEKVKGGLRLDTLAGMRRGGESGPAIVPGNPDASLLISAVRYESLEMPPDRRLDKRDLERLTRWVRMGAPWPGADGNAAAGASTRAAGFQITEADRAYWAYQAIRNALPEAASPKQLNPIDTFVSSRLRNAGIDANPRAAKQQLIRRAYFDLIGIPPTSAATSAFLEDDSPDAFERVIDRLLSLPQYGERWGRYWLDVVRFAQSNGYERDAEKPLVWRYRDYVVQSFNEDKPYDRFVMEQLAGDELADATADTVVATAFYRLGVWDDEPDDKRAAEFDGLDDILSTIGQVFLGQTVGCARCHDHMFDPISQADYYELLAFVRNIRYYENPKYELSSATYAPLAAPHDVRQWIQQRDERIAALDTQLKAASHDDERRGIQQRIDAQRKDQGPFNDWTLAVTEHGTTPRPTHVLIRGDAATPAQEVEPNFLAILGDKAPDNPFVDPHHRSSGRRKALAEWIISRDNPLSARVIANRIWQYHFGRGIVRSPNDFGKAGLPPTHPALLDWLAWSLMDGGWSLKKLHKTIMLSATYQRSSSADNIPARQLDPDNRLFWRQHARRLDAEAIRDAMLAVSGELSGEMKGRGVFPLLSGEVLAGQSKPGWGWEVSPAAQRLRRSIYIFGKRGVRDPLLESFDYVNTTSPLGVRPVTTVAPQALVLLNSRFIQQRAAALARRVAAHAGPDRTARVKRLYELALGRLPLPREMRLARGYLLRQEQEQVILHDVIAFRPDYPVSLHQDYRKRLDPTHYLIGPRSSWQYLSGIWTGGYENLEVVDYERSPFALWNGLESDRLRVRGRLMLSNAMRKASIYLSARTDGPAVRGAELRFTPQAAEVSVHWHGADQVKTIAMETVELPVGSWMAFDASVRDGKLILRLGGREALSADVPSQQGKLGIGAFGGSVALDKLVVSDGQHDKIVAQHRRLHDATSKLDSPELRALQALCTVVLNLNEFVYID